MKNDNLGDFLSDIANAIREKKGTTEAINAQNFSEEIRGIESGGIPTAEWNDVNFYDYEGTILYSYDWDEFVAKNEMPPLPTHHEGLTCQGWNYTLEEVLEQGSCAEIGAKYTTTNGRTRITTLVPQSTITLRYQQTEPNGVMIHWGDGQSESVEEVGKITLTHNYSQPSIQKVEFELIDGSLTYGHGVEGFPIIDCAADDIIAPIGKFSTASISYVKKISMPTSVMSDFMLRRGIVEVVIFHGNTSSLILGDASYYKVVTSPTYSGIAIPNDAERIVLSKKVSDVPNTSQRRRFIREIKIAKNNAKFKEEGLCIIDKSSNEVAFGCANSKIPSDVISIGDSAFYTTYVTTIIPKSVTTIGSSAFQTTWLPYIDLPNLVNMGVCAFLNTPIQYAILGDISSIKANTFYNCTNAKYYDFTRCTSVPTLANINAFTNIPTACKIIVPDNLYDKWIKASNWSNYADRIINKTTWEEQNQQL